MLALMHGRAAEPTTIRRTSALNIIYGRNPFLMLLGGDGRKNPRPNVVIMVNTAGGGGTRVVAYTAYY